MISLPEPPGARPSQKPLAAIDVEEPKAIEAIEPSEPDQPAPAQEAAAVACDEAQDAEEAQNAEEAIQASAPQPSRRFVGARNAFTAIEIVDQIDTIQEWLTQGYRPNEIRALARQEWGLSTDAATKRIHDARARIVRDINVQDRATKVAQMCDQLEAILKMSMATKQGSNAIGALRLQADLLQLLSRHH